MAGLYLHIPFCKTRCDYCDFHTSTGLNLVRPLVEAIKKEIRINKSFLEEQTLKTIYLGGGTPSILNDAVLSDLFGTIYQELHIDEDAEITLEANPDDLTPEKLRYLNTLPINRFSIGVQSFNDDELRFMNRRHGASQAIKAIEDAHAAGFENLTIDLIYGVPGQSLKSWENSLTRALNLPIKHLSSYSLMFEKGTPFYNMVQNNKLNPMDEEQVLSLFSRLIDKTKESGFTQYEISNFSKPGYESKHNSSYWDGTVYWGVGPSAHSYNGLTRQWNVADNVSYINALNDNISWYETEHLNADTMYNDFVITHMRTMAGCNMDQLEKKFGMGKRKFFMDNARQFLDAGSLHTENEVVTLTRQGIFISDHIMSELLFVS